MNVLSRLCVVVVLLVIGILLISPSVALAQVVWHSDQLIEDNAGHNGTRPDVAMSGSNVVTVWCQHDGNSSRIYSNYSTDGGATWHSDQLIENNADDGFEPSVAMSGSNVVAVWYQRYGFRFRIYSNYSTDGGATWNSSAQLIENNDWYDGFGPYVAMSGSNVVAVWYQEDSSNKHRIYSNYSTDGGATWNSSAAKVIDNTSDLHHWYPHIAMSGSNAVAVWQEEYGGNWSIYRNYSADGGATWMDAELIQDKTGVNGTYPYVAMSGSNAVAVWWQSEGPPAGPESLPPRRWYSDHSTDGGYTWGSDQPIQDSVDYFVQEQACVAISGSNAVAVWRQSEGSKSRIYSNYSTEGGATWEGAQRIEDNAWYNSSYPYVAISGSNAVAVWCVFEGNTVPRIYSNYSSDGGATWEGDQLIEDNARHKGWIPHVAVSGSNAVAVWYQEGGSPFRIFSNYLGPVVGYEVYPVNKVGVVAPWIVLAIVVATGGLYLFRRMVNNSM